MIPFYEKDSEALLNCYRQRQVYTIANQMELK